MPDALLYVVQETQYFRPTKGQNAVTHAASHLASKKQTFNTTIVQINERVRSVIECSRIKQSLTVRELAKRSNISVDLLRAYENGSEFPNATHIATLQNQLGVILVP